MKVFLIVLQIHKQNRMHLLSFHLQTISSISLPITTKCIACDSVVSYIP
jgi:hypothetical protein